MARTDTLPHFLTDVADAIRTKKGSSDTIQASDFDTEIENLPSGGGADLSDYFVDTDYNAYEPMLSRIKKFPNINISSDAGSLADMFGGMENLEEAEITFPQNPTIQITEINGMFSSCSNLTSVIINGNPDTTAVTVMQDMFAYCGSLQQLDLSKLHCQSLDNIDNVFMECTSLEFLDVRNIDFTTAASYDGLFGYDENSFNPGCEIIVADQTQKDWIETNFDFLTNVKTVAEYEAE